MVAIVGAPQPQNVGINKQSNADFLHSTSAYRLRFARTEQDRRAVYLLRFLVFNLELGEGLESAYYEGFDTDEFDSVCDHLAVEHRPSGQIVGTYRLQSSAMAARGLGFYGAREFDFSPYEPQRERFVELGRAAIHRDHRSFEVLSLLWRGIVEYAMQWQARYLIGCCSLSTQDTAEALSVYKSLSEFLIRPDLRTRPNEPFQLPVHLGETIAGVRPPKLLRAYLSIGGKICGPPAIDREFRTIDFLTLLDLQELSPAARARFVDDARSVT